MLLLAVVSAISQPYFTVQSISAKDLPDEEEVRITAIVIADERDDHLIESALASVITSKPVTAVRWVAEDVSGVD